MCNNIVTFNISTQNEYHTYCSQSCSLKDMITLIGVSNPSILESVKNKKKITHLKNYGVDTPLKRKDVQDKIDIERKARWDEYYENKDFTTDGLSLIEYQHRSRQYANTQYNNNKQMLDPLNKRGKQFHLDHIFSVAAGFKHDVPYNIISHISNLQILPASENLSKKNACHKTLTQLYEDAKSPSFCHKIQ